MNKKETGEKENNNREEKHKTELRDEEIIMIGADLVSLYPSLDPTTTAEAIMLEIVESDL